MFISCLLDIIKKSITEEICKKLYFCSYRGKKIRSWIPDILSSTLSPLATSLKGEFPINEKECLYVIVLCMFNQNIQKNRVFWDFCWRYALNCFLCIITSSDMEGFPCHKIRGSPDSPLATSQIGNSLLKTSELNV